MRAHVLKAMVLAASAAAIGAGCGAHSSQHRTVEMRFSETPSGQPARQRVHQKFALNASLIGEAALHYHKASELLNAAEGPAGGEWQKLLRAGRTLEPGQGIVLLATARAHEEAGGATSSLASYSIALGCAKADLDAPGDLTDCRGYLMRVTRQWPGEVYEIESATVSLIPEGGTARGRLRAKSAPGGFAAEVEGEFTASILELHPAAAEPASAER